ncbi:MAG: hypothetical protein ABW061_15110, partial [Polyangiaceae bacterium]
MKYAHALSVFVLSLTPACGAALPEPNLGPVSAVEITEGGEQLVIPATGVTEVDVNSSIQLKVDKGAAQKKLAATAGVDAAKIEALKQRSENLSAVIQSERAALAGLERIIESPPSTFKETQAAMRAQGNLEDAAFSSLAKIRSRKELNQLLRHSNHYSIVIAELDRENGKIVDELNDLTAKLSRVAWRMQAALYNREGEHALHLSGYDDLAEGELNVINKLAIPKDLLSVLDQTRAKTADLKDLKDALQKARAKAEEQAQNLRARLLKVEGELEALPVKLVDDVKKAPWATPGKGKDLQKGMADLASLVKGALATCKEGFAQLHGVGDASLTELARAVADPSSSVRTCLQALTDGKIAAAASALPTQINDLHRAILADAALARTIGTTALDELQALPDKLQIDATKELLSWWSAVQGLGEGPVFPDTEQLKDRAYADVADTSIELTRSARADGDYVYYRAASVNSGSVSERFTSAPLRVVTTGWHVNVSGSVVFVRALKPQAQDSEYPAAPAATATMHYGSQRASNEQHGSRFWNFIDPGLGLHVAYLDLGPKVSAGQT